MIFTKRFLSLLAFFIVAFLISSVKTESKNEVLDDCCCEVNDVLTANAKELNPLLNVLVKKRFFSYFKLDLFSKCPFWVADFLCGVGGCAICECNDDEIPTLWKQEKTDLVNVSVPENFVSWKDIDEHMWTVQGKEDDMSYVNLALYPEANTGYLDGRHVWESIYKENCFRGSLDDMCLEERVFFRLISGLHASINIHVARFWEFNKETQEWKTNPELYQQKIQPFEERKTNLYFTFLFMLRAVNKLGPVLEKYHYSTGSSNEATEVRELVKKLLSTELTCAPNFDESILFSDPEKESLRQQVKSNFRNISLIMNCVTCEKCKVYAKLQTLGLGTALKVLLEPDADFVLASIQRNEIIALINTLRQLSNSIEAVNFFENPKNVKPITQKPQEAKSEVLKPKESNPLGFVAALLIGFGAIIVFFGRSQKPKEKKH